MKEVKTYEEAAKEIRALGNFRIVFTNGCFDVLHPGHAMVLMHARQLAGPKGIVVVGLNSDDSVKRLKGEGRPVLDQQARIVMLNQFRTVDFIVTFDEDTPVELIKALQPDVIVKGGDYGSKEVVGSDVALVSIAPLIEGYSTTDIIKRMK